MFSVSVVPAGMDRLCPLVGVSVVSVGISSPGLVGLGALVGGFRISSDVILQGCSSFLPH